MSDNLANPAPLGLMGFGMTTVLLNIHNTGMFPISAVILAMGIFYGGIAQIIAGCMEFKKGNTFGTTAFTSYGLFWLTLVADAYALAGLDHRIEVDERPSQLAGKQLADSRLAAAHETEKKDLFASALAHWRKVVDAEKLRRREVKESRN